MSYYCHLSLKSWQLPLGVCLWTITKTYINYHQAWHDCKYTSTSYRYLLESVNIIFQIYISLIYCSNKHIVNNNDKLIFTYVYIEESLFISNVSPINVQEMFLITSNVSILTKVYSHQESWWMLTGWQNKDAAQNVIPNDTGNGPFVKSMIYNKKAYSMALSTWSSVVWIAWIADYTR